MSAYGSSHDTYISILCYNNNSTFNVALKKFVYLELLFASQLVKDCDLSQSIIQWPNEHDGGVELATGVWKDVKRFLDVVRDNGNADKNGAEQIASTVMLSAGDATNTAINTATTKDTEHPVRLPDIVFHNKYSVPLMRPGDANSNAKTSALTNSNSNVNAHTIDIEQMADGHMIENLMRLSDKQLDQMARSGRLPAVVIAVHALLSSHCSIAPSTIMLVPFFAVFCNSLIVLVPNFYNVRNGQPAFGATTELHIMYACCFIVFLLLNAVNVVYAKTRLHFYRLQYKMEQYLYSLVSSDLDIAALERNLTRNAPPRFDLTCPENVAAFAALYGVLHGNNFAPSLLKRFNLQLVVMVVMMVISCAIEAMPAIVVSSSRPAYVNSVGFKLGTLVRLLLFCVFLLVEIAVTHAINYYAPLIKSRVARARAQNKALAFSAQTTEQKHKYNAAADLLDALEANIESDHSVNPMKLGVVRASFGLASVLFSVITTIVFLSFRDLLDSVGFKIV